MHKRPTRLIICLLACVQVLALTACGSPSAESAPPANSIPESSPTVQSAAPIGQVPESVPPTAAYAPAPTQAPPEPTPEVTLPPDEETFLSYFVGEEHITVSALRHHSPAGYSLTYDPALFVCNSFTGGDTYWNSDGNYLSFNQVYGLTMAEVVDGLRLQGNIAMEPEFTSVGSGSAPAYTLYYIAPNGLYRQYWVMQLGEDILLAEQCFDTVLDEAASLQAVQLAMLASLTLNP